MNVFELFGNVSLKGTGQVNQELSRLEKNTQRVQKGLKIGGAAFTAMGAAGLAVVQSTKKINAQLGVTALNLGVTVKEMRELTLATTNVTFPIDEVTKTFDLLARAGVEDQQVLKDVATAFDTLGDAMGMPASLVTEKLIPTMKTFNLTAEEVSGKTDAMTYLFRNTTVSLDDFNRMVGYVTPDLVEMGLTTEDMIAILADLEDQGYSGEVMTREFRKAVTEATKKQIPLNEALGISEEKINAYKDELKGATGLTQEYADAANEQFTLMDELKQKWSELTLKASGFLEPLEPILSGMTALGPLMMIMSTSAGTAAIKWGLHTVALVAHKVALLASAVAIKVVTAAQWLWNAAMAANPIGLIIIAIAALIAAGWAIYKNWDKIVAFFKGIPEKFRAIFSKLKDIILAPFRAAWKGIGDGINWLIRQINKIKIPKIVISGWVIFGGWKGLNIPEITLPKFGRGGLIPEPTLLYGLKSQRPYAIAGEAGVESIVPGAGGGITNEFNIAQLVVREEADVERIARELYQLQQRKVRAVGG